MRTVPFTALANLERTGVDVTLLGPRGSVTAIVTFTADEARELQRQLGVALHLLRPAS